MNPIVAEQMAKAHRDDLLREAVVRRRAARAADPVRVVRRERVLRLGSLELAIRRTATCRP